MLKKEISPSKIIAKQPMTEQLVICFCQAHQSQHSTSLRAPTNASHVNPRPLTAPIRAHPATRRTNQSSRDKPAPQGSKLGHFIKFLLERYCSSAAQRGWHQRHPSCGLRRSCSEINLGEGRRRSSLSARLWERGGTDDEGLEEREKSL